jgi:release factor glutamine methyltransferase
MEKTREEKQLLKEKYAGKVCEEYEEDCKRLAVGEPLAYVIGNIPFLGSTIYLDSKPLIPRPETEEWTRDALERLKRRRGSTIRILDLFCGSGAVGVALARALPQAHVTFADIRKDHLSTAQKNARENGISLARVTCVESDVFRGLPKGVRFDAILANPPYIPSSRTLPESVSRYEPHDALFGGNDGLDLILQTLERAHEYLEKPYGVLYLEHDISQKETLRRLAHFLPYDIEWRRDQYGAPRYLVARAA